MPEPSKLLQFRAKLLRSAKAEDVLAFVILPKDVSANLPRRGRTTVLGTLNGSSFQATLEPDGQLSHWLKLSQELQEAAGVKVGDMVTLKIQSVEQEPEPGVPRDFQDALAAAPAAWKVWCDTTTIARVDWIHWIESAKQAKTRAKRINDACDMLATGKARVCCFDPSGFYSKAFRAPEHEK
ncbi:MAG: YdeI/OmpD-associated family protein [Verrucomicrobiales bacterium]